jgi:hypothetical protein
MMPAPPDGSNPAMVSATGVAVVTLLLVILMSRVVSSGLSV